MKLFLALLFVSLPVVADEWTSADTYRESTYLVLHTLDWRQTQYIAKHPEKLVEFNPVIGTHPSDSEVNRYFIATGLLHVAASYYLPKVGRILPEILQRTLYVDHWRKAFQYVSISVQSGVVHSNYLAGIKIIF